VGPELEIVGRGREEEVDSGGIRVLGGRVQGPHSVARESMLVQGTLGTKLHEGRKKNNSATARLCHCAQRAHNRWTLPLCNREHTTGVCALECTELTWGKHIGMPPRMALGGLKMACAGVEGRKDPGRQAGIGWGGRLEAMQGCRLQLPSLRG